MSGSMVDIQSATAEIRRGKKKNKERRNRTKNIMSASATQGGHNKDKKKTITKKRYSPEKRSARCEIIFPGAMM